VITACLDNAGAAIGASACVVFNSRGIPIDIAGTPTSLDAFYMTGPGAVYGVTVAATGQIRLWKRNTGGNWIQQ
jgi:hypothetical protein